MADSKSDLPVPESITLAPGGERLTVAYEGGVRFEFTAEYLRVMAPSADVQGHGGQGGRLVAGKRSVTIAAVEPVGRYAVRLVFSDGHRNGIYTWKTLLSLGVNQAGKWDGYLAALDAAGLSRDGGGGREV